MILPQDPLKSHLPFFIRKWLITKKPVGIEPTTFPMAIGIRRQKRTAFAVLEPPVGIEPTTY